MKIKILKSREKAEEYLKEKALDMNISTHKIEEFNYKGVGCTATMLSVKIDSLISIAFAFSEQLGSDDLTIDEAVSYYPN